jgi:hypothetical protein
MEIRRTGGLSNGYAAAGRGPTSDAIRKEIRKLKPKGASLSTENNGSFWSGWQYKFGNFPPSLY